MNQLEKITLGHFRGLRDVELAELGPVNLLVGANNSGKTTLLEALSIYSRPLDPFTWIEAARRRELSTPSLSTIDALKWLFPRAGKGDGEAPELGPISLSGRGLSQCYEVKTTAVELERRVTAGDAAPAGGQLGLFAQRALHQARAFSAERDSAAPLDDLTDTISDRVQEVMMRALKEPWQQQGLEVQISIDPGASSNQETAGYQFQLWEEEPFRRTTRIRAHKDLTIPSTMVTAFSHRIAQVQIEQLSKADLKGFKDSVVEMMRQLDPSVRDLVILSPGGLRPSLYVRHEQLGLAPLSVFGDGFRRAIFYALTLPTVSNGLLLIDELETALHVSVLERLFAWLTAACQQYNVQLFATTHSLEALDAILRASAQNLDQIAGFKLEGQGTVTRARRYSGPLLHRLRHERGLDVR